MLYGPAIVEGLYHAIMSTLKAAPNSAPESAPAQRLTLIFAGLCDADRHSLLAFAEFLAAGRPSAPTPTASPDDTVDESADAEREPIPHPRPAQETVIAAIRRLSLTYPMLDRGPMLHETAGLMTAHMMHGRSAVQVIDDLEALFLRYFQDSRADLRGGG